MEYISIGERLRKIRKDRGLMLREVSIGAELSISFISDIEHGRVMPSLITCQKFASFYNMPLSKLFEGVFVEGK
jgi:transcriptional regulator with XRE-family HTH domain